MTSLYPLALASSLTILNACSLHAERPSPIGAGIIAAACKNHSTLYLLARERDRNRNGWGHLGGTQQRGEPLLATALREFHEESNCSFNLDNPHSLQLTGPSRNGKFFTYHMKVKHHPIANITESPTCRTIERDQWVWVRRNDLLTALQKNTQPAMVAVAEGKQQAIPLWEPAAMALRQAIIDRVIPAKDPCDF